MLIPDALPLPWLPDALCAGSPGPWDADADESARRDAQGVCAACGVRAECFELGRSERLSGIWGGADLIGGQDGEAVRAKVRAAVNASEARRRARRLAAA